MCEGGVIYKADINEPPPPTLQSLYIYASDGGYLSHIKKNFMRMVQPA